MPKTPREKKSPAGACPQCGFVNDRPHVAVCLRCNGPLPGASGCSGCGACRGRG